MGHRVPGRVARAARVGTKVVIVLLLLLGLPPVRGAQVVVPRVWNQLPHDTAAFTQGFLYHDGVFYESTGLYGQSTLRRNDPASGLALARIDIASGEFGEGLARVGRELIQITWREHVAHRYDIDYLSPIEDHLYTGEGWGICFDGERLVMSDGSGVLTFRDAQTFEPLGQVQVSLDGSPVDRLNELECVGRLVYANVWPTDTILRIDPASGAVLTLIDASDLLSPEEAQQADVLNGVAFHPATGRFYLTGKFWPWVFEVDLDLNPYGGCEAIDGLGSVGDVRLDKDQAGGLVFTWDPDLEATEYHVNSVDSRDALAPPGPHRPDRNGGVGHAECDATAGQTNCTVAARQEDPPPTVRFYQVFSACGPGGIDEGPD